MNSGQHALQSIDSPVSALEDDLRWQLVERILASRHFARAPLLSKFLSHICAETLQGNQAEIGEYQIGVQVFDRPKNYRTVEDNIVRNYARQLRKRLAEYFVGEGREEALRIEIPLGGYVPVFSPRPAPPAAVEEIRTDPQLPRAADSSGSEVVVGEATSAPLQSAVRTLRMRWPLRIALFTAYSAILIIGSVVASQWMTVVHGTTGPSSMLWRALFGSELDTIIVPADSGFNILQDLSHKQLTLASYLKGEYLNVPLPTLDAHSQTDVRSQEFTSFVDLQVVTALARLPEVAPERFFVRFPRDLHLDDMKSSNVILIGSDGSNPWAEIAQQNLNFRIMYNREMQSAWIENAHPHRGELNRYLSLWDEPAHSTYAVIAYEPNVTGNGHILLIEGLDVAGTQAAAEALLHGDALKPVLRAAASGNSLRPFEALLKSTSIASSAAGAEVVAYRVE